MAALSEPIAIIGTSALFPQAESLGDYWSNIKRGVDSITDVPESHWRAEDYYDADPKSQDHIYTTHGGFLPDVPFNPIEFGISPTQMEATDTSQLLGLLVAHGALVDAGYGPEREFSRDRTSVILGVTGALELTVTMGARLGHPVWREALSRAGVHPEVIEEVVQSIGDAYVGWQEDTFPGLLGNVVAGRISNRLDLGGTNCVVDAACASSLSAAHLAMLELTSGRADMAITGGVDTFNDIFMYSCFSKTLALSKTGDVRPFDQNADGTILGEGIGMVVLKRLADAERDGDKIYAVVKGIGSSSDGRGKAIYAPSAEGQERALREAYRQAGVSPDTIELVEAHGTGTKVGDATEVSALTKIYREAREEGVWCALGSVKSQIGHTKAAAGVAGMIKVAMALRHKVIPPTIKVSEPNSAVDVEKGPFYLPARKRPWLSRGLHPRRAAVSALGFGGTNFHVVLEEHKPAKSEIDWDGRVQIVALSAETLDELRTKLDEFARGDFSWKELSRRATRSRRDFSSQHAYRLIQVLERDKHAPKVLFERLREDLDLKGDQRFWSTREGAYFGQGKRLGKLGFLFPGQGSQYVGMCLDLACVFPQMQDALTEADVAFGDLRDVARQLSDFIYPPHVFGLDADKLNALALRATDVAQPAIGAVSVGALCILTMFGVFPAAAAGHSYGELMALFAGGRIDAPTLLHLSRLRGELMAQGEGDRGSMIAVRTSPGEADQIIAEEGLDLIVANRNGPAQVVLSGRTDEVQRAAGIFSERKIGATALPVAAAFHSPLVANAQAPFRDALNHVRIGPGSMDVFANSTGDLYPEDADEVRELLGSQLARPVEFVKEIEAMYASGVRTFVEVGPGNRMSGLVRAILGDREHVVLSIDRSAGRGNGMADLAEALGQIAALGHESELALWEDGKVDGQTVELDGDGPAESGMKIMINGANYRRVKPERLGSGSSNGNGKVTGMPSTQTTFKTPDGKAPAAATPNRGEVSASHQRNVSPPPRVASASAEAQGPLTPPPVAPRALPSSFPASVPNNPAFTEALQSTQASLLALQQLQQNTAELHRKFLEGQEEAQRALHQLIGQQEMLFQQGLGFSTPRASSSPPVSSVASMPSPAPGALPAEAPVPSPVVPPATAAAAQASAPSADDSGLLLRIVGEKTGYPEEMLSLEMDLESDLGIDSIKRVEILSTLQEELPHLPTIEADELSNIRTLSDIVAFMNSVESPMTPNLAVPTAPVPSVASPAAKSSGNGAGELAALLLGVVAEKTGYPKEMLQLEMDMESDLGIDSIKRVEILSEMQELLPDVSTPEAEELGELRTLADVVAFLGADAPVAAGPSAPHSNGAPPTGAPGNGAAGPDPHGNETASSDALRQLLLAVVSEKTGYPSDMLNLEMEMESDLGIDSIKRVEILSEMQERLPELPMVEPDDIGDIRTLQHILNHLSQTSASMEVTAAAPSNEEGRVAPPARDEAHGIERNGNGSNGSAAHAAAHTAGHNAAQNAAQSRSPVELRRTVLEAVLSERPGTGKSVTIPAGSEILVMGRGGALRQLIADRLEAAGHPVRLLAIGDVEKIREIASLGGLILVSDTSAPQPGKAWNEDAEPLLSDAFVSVQAAAQGLRRTGREQGAFLTLITRMDGCFGLAEASADFDPLQGGLAGLAKTARHEWPEVSCRVVDVASDFPEDENLADAILEECFIEGAPEVGFSAEGRQVLKEVSNFQGGDGPGDERLFEAGDAVVISGGGRGVTAETALALARSFQPTLVLLGRTPLPDVEPDWLRPLVAEAEIKKALLVEANGSAPTPRQLQQKFEAIRAARELSGNLRRMEAAGSRVLYRAVDIRDTHAVERVLDEVREETGPIRGIIHGAGVLADRLIEEKTPEQLHAVLSTKIGGMKALLQATRRDPLRVVAFFSSSTARYGRKGQVDYAMANEALNKVAQRESRLRPECRVVSFNWGPWAGGMVTPALEKVFASEGVGVIPLEAGGQFLVDELQRSPLDVEVVVGAVPAAPKAANRQSETLVEDEPMRTAFEFPLSLEQFPVLESHVIDGRPVLPVALMLEWFSHAALHDNPGLCLQGVDELRVLNGVKLDPGASYPIRVLVSRVRKNDEGWSVDAQLRGGEDGTALHARCRIQMGTAEAAAESRMPVMDLRDKYPRLVRESYREVLFHGPVLQGIDRIAGWSAEGIEASVKCSPSPGAWIREPARSDWLTDPLAIDCALQLLILWTYEQHGQVSLPTRFGRYRQFASKFGESVDVQVRATSSRGSLVHADIDFIGADGRLVARIEDCEHVMDARLIEAFARLDPMADPMADPIS